MMVTDGTIRFLVIVALTSSLVWTVGCTASNPGSNDGWQVREDTGGDAGTDVEDDSSTPDTSRDTSGLSCYDRATQNECEAKDECRWGTVRCSEDGPVTGCYNGLAGEPVLCPTCDTVDSETTCDAAPNCRWHTYQCHGETYDYGCVANDVAIDVGCPTIDPAKCPEFTDSCPPSACQSLEAGCGTPPSDDVVEIDGSMCVPDTSCESDVDCPGELICASVHYNPCAGSSCDACGATQSFCVSPEHRENTTCEGLDSDACAERDDCEGFWPPECQDQPQPEGTVSYDSFKCLPRPGGQSDSRCEPGLVGCPDDYGCGTVWHGCGPTEFCSECAFETDTCVPLDVSH